MFAATTEAGQRRSQLIEITGYPFDSANHEEEVVWSGRGLLGGRTRASAAVQGDRPTSAPNKSAESNGYPVRNNLNRSRIFSFRARLQTPQSVSMPSCHMKPNRGCVRAGQPETAYFSVVFRPASQCNR